MGILRRDRDRIRIRVYTAPEAKPDLLAESAAREEAGRQAASRATGLPSIPRSAYRDRDGEPAPDPVAFGPPRAPQASL